MSWCLNFKVCSQLVTVQANWGDLANFRLLNNTHELYYINLEYVIRDEYFSMYRLPKEHSGVFMQGH